MSQTLKEQIQFSAGREANGMFTLSLAEASKIEALCSSHYEQDRQATLDEAIEAVKRTAKEQHDRWKSMAEEAYVLAAMENSYLHVRKAIEQLKEGK